MKIILCGMTGRMGMTVYECAVAKGMNITAGVALDAGEIDGIKIYNTIDEVNEPADLLLDFSHHSQTNTLLEYAGEKKIPIVIATTGQTDEELASIIEYSKKGAVFYSRNMSLGINALCELAKQAAIMLGDGFDVEIIEMHHHNKLDAPSGTALMLEEEIKSVLSYQAETVTERASKFKERDPKEIGVHSIRGGSIIGEHEILFCGNGETIKLSHSAQGREVFAEGALRACEFMKGKTRGIFTMKEMLKNAKNFAGVK